MAQSRAFRSIVNSYGFKQRLRQGEPKEEKKEKKAWPEFRPPKETIEVGSFYRLNGHHQTLLLQVLSVNNVVNRIRGFYSFNENEVECLILEVEIDESLTAYERLAAQFMGYSRRTFEVGKKTFINKEYFKRSEGAELIHPDHVSNSQCLGFLLKNQEEKENDSSLYVQF